MGIRVPIDHGILERILYVKVIREEKSNVSLSYDSSRFIPFKVLAHEVLRYFIHDVDITFTIRVRCTTWCLLCGNMIEFIACGVLCYVLPPHGEISDEDIPRYARRCKDTLALAASSIAIKRHLSKVHGITLKARKRSNKLYIARTAGSMIQVTHYYGIEPLVYECPFCGEELNGLKSVMLHLKAKHSKEVRM